MIYLSGNTIQTYLTIDEKFEGFGGKFKGFRGRCNFRKNIVSKSNKYGIKIFALCAAKMYYTANLEVYEVQEPEGP